MIKKFLSIKQKRTIMVILAITTMCFSMIVYGDTFSGTRHLDSNKEILSYNDASVDANGYTTTFALARLDWAAYSSGMTGIVVTPSNGTYVDEHYVSTTATSGLLGQTFPKKYGPLNIQLDAGANEDWAFCEVYVYKNQMDANKMTDPQKISNIAHELGHSAKLAHPTTTQTSIMNQGIQSIGPTTYDIAQLRSKWGQ